ncbi:hypothetical protein pb186bvf_001976 [Paramecium bursaria]
MKSSSNNISRPFQICIFLTLCFNAKFNVVYLISNSMLGIVYFLFLSQENLSVHVDQKDIIRLINIINEKNLAQKNQHLYENRIGTTIKA